MYIQKNEAICHQTANCSIINSRNMNWFFLKDNIFLKDDIFWRERVGIEPTTDRITARQLVLKTRRATRPNPLPQADIIITQQQ